MLRSFRAWLERVPIADPVQRERAVTVQVLCLFGTAWVAVSVTAALVRGLFEANALDLAIGCAIAPALLAAVVLLRSGRYRPGVHAAIAGGSIPLALLVARGLEFSLPRLPLLTIPIVASALLLRRRDLWTVSAGVAVVLAVAAGRDVGRLGGPTPVRAAVPLGLLAETLLTFLVVTVLLDRFGGLLRDALQSALGREADLRASEERLRLTFETSPDAMNLVRIPDGVYVEVNRAFERMTGFGAAEIVGRTSAERELWVDRAQRASLMDRIRSGAPVDNVEAEFRRKDGTTFTGLISAKDVTISGTRYLLAVVRDITERKRSELEREALREQLRQAQKLEAMGRLAGGIAHDFNNVLTSILASAQLVKDALPAGHPCRDDVQQIDADGRRAAELTRQLLSFARREEAKPQIIRLEDRGASLEKLLRRTMGANIAVETSFSRRPWPVFIDPGQVEQVILNLAVNARDAMPEGGRLEIATENVTVGSGAARAGEPPPGDYVRLTVADTGIGMTPDVAAHAFEPFFTTKGRQGTGLGLATCFGIVTQAGGTIAVDSARGAGTRVVIHLPRAEVVATTSEEPETVDVAGDETLLMVEDDAMLRRIMTRSLQHLGYEVLEAGSASEAEAKVSRHAGRIDCVVIDVQLPDGEGRAAAERILAGRAAVPVLFVSGDPDRPAAVREREDPSSAFLAKPFTSIDLARRVRALIDRARGPRERAG